MRKRYAVCGVSNRALKMFVKPMLSLFQEQTEVVGLLDPDPRRFEVAGEQYPTLKKVPCYKPEELEKMLQECKPDVLLIAGRDNTHARYVLAALEHDIDSLVEKPMAAGAEDCQKIIDAEKKSKGRVQVTFNYRYTAIHRGIKEMILQGKVGRITSIDLNWYIDTYHGSSYFRRWNRYREISGGLSIHKASHHFDLVNWWTGQRPEEVFAFGALNYYGPEGSKNPSEKPIRKTHPKNPSEKPIRKTHPKNPSEKPIRKTHPKKTAGTVRHATKKTSVSTTAAGTTGPAMPRLQTTIWIWTKRKRPILPDTVPMPVSTIRI